ncbi:MAG: hydroxysqualene dehydroxylase HpnE [Burkholderiaceae bacterium]
MSKGDLPTAPHIAVVGAGWAGCAAAIELAKQGCQVTLLEASRTLGGRARRVEIAQSMVDNGQHILLAAYTQALRLMCEVGIVLSDAVMRLPLQMRYPAFDDGMDFVAARLPAPLHLAVATVRAKGLRMEDKLALARFSSAARWMDWRLDQDCSVSELLDRFDQTERLIRLMWRPLCIAALTTPPERASARVFLSVLRDSLGARRAASDMLLPKADLTALFPEFAAHYLENRGSKVLLGAAVKAIRQADRKWKIDVDSNTEISTIFDGVIVATSPWQAADLMRGKFDTSALTALQYEPISTCYLQYSSELSLPSPFFALAENPEQNKWAQFVFDRGQLHSSQAGLLAAVISSSREAIADGHDTLAASIASQLAAAFRMPELAQPLWSKVITEKRACFACTPDVARPANDIGLPRLVLAGDYTAGDYPATLEGAARSGVKAAAILRDMLA